MQGIMGPGSVYVLEVWGDIYLNMNPTNLASLVLQYRLATMK